MKQITAKQLRKMWLDFFSERGHAIISSASLIPENDPTVLFSAQNILRATAFATVRSACARAT